MITKEQLEKGENSEDDIKTLELKTKIGSSIDKNIVLVGDVSSCCHNQNSDHGNTMPFLALPMTDRVQNSLILVNSFQA